MIKLTLKPKRTLVFVEEKEGKFTSSQGVDALANFIFFTVFRQIVPVTKADIARQVQFQEKMLAVSAKNPVLELEDSEFEDLKISYEKALSEGKFKNEQLDFLAEINELFFGKDAKKAEEAAEASSK